MNESIKEPNYSKNESTNESKDIKKVQTSSSKATYQRLFSEDDITEKKFKIKKSIMKKKLLIIAIILIPIILSIIAILYCSSPKEKDFPREYIQTENIQITNLKVKITKEHF